MTAMTQAEMAKLLASGALAAKVQPDGRAKLAEAIKLPGGRRHSPEANRKDQAVWRAKHQEEARRRAREGMRALRRRKKAEAEAERKSNAKIRKSAKPCKQRVKRVLK